MYLFAFFPSDKSLGYSQSSLRDGAAVRLPTIRIFRKHRIQGPDGLVLLRAHSVRTAGNLTPPSQNGD